VEQKLDRMVQQNPTRLDLYGRYQEIIEAYNRETEPLSTISSTTKAPACRLTFTPMQKSRRWRPTSSATWRSSTRSRRRACLWLRRVGNGYYNRPFARIDFFGRKMSMNGG